MIFTMASALFEYASIVGIACVSGAIVYQCQQKTRLEQMKDVASAFKKELGVVLTDSSNDPTYVIDQHYYCKDRLYICFPLIKIMPHPDENSVIVSNARKYFEHGPYHINLSEILDRRADSLGYSWSYVMVDVVTMPKTSGWLFNRKLDLSTGVYRLKNYFYDTAPYTHKSERVTYQEIKDLLVNPTGMRDRFFREFKPEEMDEDLHGLYVDYPAYTK